MNIVDKIPDKTNAYGRKDKIAVLLLGIIAIILAIIGSCYTMNAQMGAALLLTSALLVLFMQQWVIKIYEKRIMRLINQNIKKEIEN